MVGSFSKMSFGYWFIFVYFGVGLSLSCRFW